MQSCSAIKSEIMKFADKWLEFDIIILSKVTQSQEEMAKHPLSSVESLDICLNWNLSSFFMH